MEDLLEKNEAALCGIIETEIWHGLRKHEQHEIAKLMTGLPYLEVNRKLFQDAGKLLRSLREKGVTIPLSDA